MPSNPVDRAVTFVRRSRWAPTRSSPFGQRHSGPGKWAYSRPKLCVRSNSNSANERRRLERHPAKEKRASLELQPLAGGWTRCLSPAISADILTAVYSGTQHAQCTEEISQSVFGPPWRPDIHGVSARDKRNRKTQTTRVTGQHCTCANCWAGTTQKWATLWPPSSVLPFAR